MTSFGWKRKAGQHVSKQASSSFLNDAKDDGEEVESGEVDWLTLVPKNKHMKLEDRESKSARLKNEGIILAESERFWEAIRKWDEAITYTPTDACLYEMKSQALMNLNELFPALTTASKVVELNPQWWTGYQTLGRTQLNMGEVKLAVRSFSIAVHLNPGDRELWEEDLRWAVKLMERKVETELDLEREKAQDSLTITELDEEDLDQENNPPSISSQGPNEEAGQPRRVSNEPCKKIVDLDNKSVKRIPKDYVQMRDR